MKASFIFLFIFLSATVKAQTIQNEQIDSIYRKGLEFYRANDWENAIQSLCVAKFLYMNLYAPRKRFQQIRPIDQAIDFSFSKLRVVPENQKPESIIACDTCDHR